MRKIVMLLFVMMMFCRCWRCRRSRRPAQARLADTTGWRSPLVSPSPSRPGLAAQGQGKAASAACEALGRNPAARAGIQVALILGLAFIESLVLFTLVIIFVKVVSGNCCSRALRQWFSAKKSLCVHVQRAFFF